MLSEKERDLLEGAVYGLLSSFDPLDALEAVPIRALFTSEEYNQIRSTRNRQSRISTFFRFYVRKDGISLVPLREYFAHSTQYFLADLLSGIVHVEDEPSPSHCQPLTHPRILHALSETMVPPRVKNHVRRQALVKKLCAKLVSLAKLDSFWLVIDGIAGSGKTSLIVDVLRDCPHLLSLYFSDIVWIRDQCDVKSRLSSLYCHAKVMVTPPESLERFGEDPEVIKLDVAKCIAAMPFPLVIIDEIYLEDSVRWFDSLNCRIVATTSNRGLFHSAANQVEHFSLDSKNQFSFEETRAMFAECRPTPTTSLLNNIVAESGGNPALIAKMKEISRNRTDRLQRCLQLLKDSSLHRLRCSTSYPSPSMCEAVAKMTTMLSEGERKCLESLTKYPPDASFSLADAASTMPIDVCGRESEVDRALEQLEIFVDCNLLEEIETRSEQIEEHYRYQMSPVIHKYLRNRLESNREPEDGSPSVPDSPMSSTFSWLGWTGIVSAVIAGVAYVGFRRGRKVR
ncbi:hypothetical protein QR680_013091 [Steinernema hermaphroditum]|uniref:NB-ARC domain-containing protein n=1 Tax=Steinernema hermaphroditum TaxID=289476 RepID=A0AA39I4B7_9BILA|nr:hypothetical protein QR680_013091 [Steinernema hermaphroditum]